MGRRVSGGGYVCTAVAIAVLLIPLSLKPADTLPAQIPDAAFWQMLTGFSEEAGPFRFQYMSNEREFAALIPDLKKSTKPGGIYLGVGPEQNFSYIAALRPRIAFIFDIRRENMLEHLMYKAVFELSPNRVEFISRLFSRATPAGLSGREKAITRSGSVRSRVATSSSTHKSSLVTPPTRSSNRPASPRSISASASSAD